MNLFNCKAKTALEETQKQIDRIDTALVVYHAISIYCRANGTVSPFTKPQLEAIVKKVAEIKRRDNVSLRRALDGYRMVHANDPRFDVFEANKLKYWKRKVRVRSLSGSYLRGDAVKFGD